MTQEIDDISAPQNKKDSGKKRGLPKEAEPFKFKPGQSGNPGGRPKQDLRAVLALKAFEILCHPDNLAKSAADVAKLIKSNPKMFQVTSDGAFGKVPQTLNLTGEISVSNVVADRLRAARKRVKS